MHIYPKGTFYNTCWLRNILATIFKRYLCGTLILRWFNHFYLLCHIFPFEAMLKSVRYFFITKSHAINFCAQIIHKITLSYGSVNFEWSNVVTSLFFNQIIFLFVDTHQCRLEECSSRSTEQGDLSYRSALSCTQMIPIKQRSFKK